jgi:hypothetical protein
MWSISGACFLGVYFKVCCQQDLTFFQIQFQVNAATHPRSIRRLSLGEPSPCSASQRRWCLQVLLFVLALISSHEVSAFIPAQGIFESAASPHNDSSNSAVQQGIPALEERARAGEAEAQLNLGVLYMAGRGVKQDYAQALLWLRLAAEQGNPRAQNNVGALYAEGKGVTADYQQARYWYEQAARQGDIRAEINLGTLYCMGLGVPADCQEGAHWVLKAALQGDVTAEETLATLYMRGEGMPHDHISAYVWLTRAARQGDRAASVLLEHLREHMTADERTEAEKRLTIASHVWAH